MHLILTSSDFQNEKSRNSIINNLKTSIEECRVLFIPNDKATFEAIHSELYYNRVQAFGFNRDYIYVFDYYNSENYTDLNIDAIYISGGNTFRTLDRLKKCGFDKTIINYVNHEVTYIGGSTGTHIATKNIEHVLNFDDNLTDIKDFNGLSLFDGIIFCHYSDERKKYYEKALSEGKYKVYTLTDEDFIVINN